MNKQQFLDTLGQSIRGLPQREREQSLEYYREMIDDRMEEGMPEEQAVAEIGSVDEAVSHILSDISLPQLVKAKVKPRRALRTGEVVLLVLGFPLWFPLLLAAAAIFLTLYLFVWVVILALYTVNLAFAVAGMAGLAGGVIQLVMQDATQALPLFGMGLIGAGLAILLFFAFNQLTRLLLTGSKQLLLHIKALFIRKGETA